jgi:aryl-alcohol dehydrogenase-like predicted oxidoreductase
MKNILCSILLRESLNRLCILILTVTGVGTTASALGDDGVLDIDTTISLETTWHAMEDLVSMGLVRSIGIRYSIPYYHWFFYVSFFKTFFQILRYLFS